MFNFMTSYEKLTPSEQKVLSYIVNHIEEIPYIQIKELSENTFVSKTVIINLSQKLGFHGFKELKFYVNNQLLLSKREEVKNDYTVVETLESNISKSFSLINEQDLLASAKLLKNAHNIFILARGTSKPAGYYLEHLLFSLGLHCFFISDYNLSETFTRLVSEKDVVIFISLSGETQKVIETAKKVHLNKGKIISMTGFQTNSLGRYADYRLFSYTDESDTRREDSISRIGFFMLIDL